MDTDELDQWLEADDGEGSTSSRAWAATPPPAQPRSDGRPRWLWPAVGGAVLWVAVLAVLLSDRGEPTQAATPPASDLLVESESAANGVDAPDATVAVPADALLATPAEAPPDAPTDRPAAAEDAALTTDAPDLGRMHGAAVAALRGVLTTSTADADRYLELATPVGHTPLGEGAAVIVLQAVWLEGTDGQLSEVAQGRWAVPLAADATVLGTPWPVAAGAADAAMPEEPPVGTIRLPEVEMAMTAAGWGDVQALAAQDHPFIDGVLVALVQGSPPIGRPADGEVVWLHDTAEGLVLLGADR